MTNYIGWGTVRRMTALREIAVDAEFYARLCERYGEVPHAVRLPDGQVVLDAYCEHARDLKRRAQIDHLKHQERVHRPA